MGGSPVPAHQPRPRPRPPHLRPLPALGVVDVDRSDQDQTDRPRRSPRVPPPAQIPQLTASQARLVAWLERYAVRLTPKDRLPHLVHYEGPPRPAFHAARGFVLRYGSRLILQAVNELTYWHVDIAGTVARAWSDEIVSPARRLYAYVRELDALSRDQAEDLR